MKMDNI